MSETTGAISLSRLLKVLLPIAAIALGVRYTLPSYEKAAQEQFETSMLTKLLGKNAEGPATTIEFADSDGDLLCDSPDADACVTPEKLIFSYVGGPEEVDESETWADLIAALSEATGLPAEYTHYKSSTEQLEALATGELHVVGLNTGAVPTAVEAAGFHPVCTLGTKDGSFGYRMQLVARTGGEVKSLDDLPGKYVAFTTPDSNSGFKAALMHLLNEHDLQPERDYEWGFTFGHETSINELVAGDHAVAPVASDILERMINDGEIEGDALVVVYESERFPPASIGYAHNLAPELREKISETLLGFDWAGTSVEAKYASSGAEAFVPVNFKDDWAGIRRIDDAVENAKQSVAKR